MYHCKGGPIVFIETLSPRLRRKMMTSSGRELGWALLTVMGGELFFQSSGWDVEELSKLREELTRISRDGEEGETRRKSLGAKIGSLENGLREKLVKIFGENANLDAMINSLCKLERDTRSASRTVSEHQRALNLFNDDLQELRNAMMNDRRQREAIELTVNANRGSFLKASTPRTN